MIYYARGIEINYALYAWSAHNVRTNDTTAALHEYCVQECNFTAPQIELCERDKTKRTEGN